MSSATTPDGSLIKDTRIQWDSVASVPVSEHTDKLKIKTTTNKPETTTKQQQSDSLNSIDHLPVYFFLSYLNCRGIERKMTDYSRCPG